MEVRREKKSFAVGISDLDAISNIARSRTLHTNTILSKHVVCFETHHSPILYCRVTHSVLFGIIHKSVCFSFWAAFFSLADFVGAAHFDVD